MFRRPQWLSRVLGADGTTVSRAPAESVASQATPRLGSAVPEWKIGDEILGTYVVMGLHETGGMGLVYRVHHRVWDVDLALKLPRHDFFQSEAQKSAFVRECETWVGLGLHPHVVTCHYIRAINDVPCIFSEYVEGGTLAEWIRAGTLYESDHSSAFERIVDVAIQMAWGLQFAHERGIVHQDVKPSNVLLNHEGEAKITDFGIAKASEAVSEAQPPEKRHGILVSSAGMTPAYCSPEQASRSGLSSATDIWSWAVSVMEMFSGGVRWMSGQVAMEALQDLLDHPQPDVRIPKIPPALADVLRRCFNPTPNRRPEHMSGIADELKAIFRDATGRSYYRETPSSASPLADNFNNRALSMLDLGRPSRARDFWRDALAVDSCHPESTYNRAISQWLEGKQTDEDVLEQVGIVIKRLPQNWLCHYAQALVEMARGNMAGAHSALVAAERLQPQQPAISETIASLGATSDSWGRLVATLVGHGDTVMAGCVSSDGRLVLSGGRDRSSRLWQTSTGECIRILRGHEDPVTAVCLSEDARLAATASGGESSGQSSDNTIRLWDVASGECVHVLKGHAAPVRTLCFSTDSRMALSGSDDKTVRLWDATTGNILQTFVGHKGRVKAACFNRAGTFAASGSEDGSVLVWDITTGECQRSFENIIGDVSALCLSPDSGRLISAGTSGGVALCDITAGGVLSTVHFQDSILAVHQDEVDRAVLGGLGSVRIWSFEQHRCVSTFKTGTLLPASIRKVGTRAHALARESGTHALLLWELPDPASSQRIPLLLSRVRRFTEISAAEREFRTCLTLAAQQQDAGESKAAMALLDQAGALPGFERSVAVRSARAKLGLKGRRTLLRSTYPLRRLVAHTDVPRSVCFSPDGATAASAGWDASICLWDVGTGNLIRRAEALGGSGGPWCRFECVALSSPGPWCLTGDFSGSIELWDLNGGKRLRTFHGHEGGVRSLSFSADARFAVSAGTDATLRLWDIQAGNCVRTLRFTDEVRSVCLSEDEQLAVVSCNGIRLIELATERETQLFEGDCGVLTSDARLVLASSEAGVRVWDAHMSTCLRTLDCSGCVAVSKDARFAFVAPEAEGSVSVWDIRKGECVGAIEGKAPLAVSPDGRYLVCGHDVNDLQLWELDWDWDLPLECDWHDGATPYLDFFLTLHSPYDRRRAATASPFARTGAPQWQQQDFAALLHDLQLRGFGWLRAAGVRKKLEERRQVRMRKN